MAKQKAAPTLVYFHIPKTAGSTMMGILRANYGDGFYRVPNGGGWRKFHKRPEKECRAITCLTGHMPWGVQNGTIEGPYQTATMLRHPVDRIESLYHFIRRFTRHKWHSFAKHKGLVGFATSGAFADIDNGITRWLAGCEDCGSLKIKHALNGGHLALALLHLDRMEIGFVSDFDASVRRFARAFDWKHTKYERKQVQKPYQRATAEQRSIIAEYNRFDVDLYEYALRSAE